MNIINLSRIILISIYSIILISCGSEKSKNTELRLKSTTLKGDLSEYYEAVDKKYILEESSVSSNGSNAMITVELKRNNEDFKFTSSKINPFGTNGDEDYHIGFGIEIFNENGPVVIRNAREGGIGGVYSSDDVINVINLKKGESGFIRWSFYKEAKFNLKDFQITSALQKENNTYTISNNSEPFIDESKIMSDNELLIYEGTIKNYPIVMELKFKNKASECDNNGQTIEGYYYYKKSGEKNKLIVKGIICNDSIKLKEFDISNNSTGNFNGLMNGKRILGNWNNSSKKLKWSVDCKNCNINSSNEVAIKNNSIIKTTNTTTLDEALNSYEEYVDQYILFLTKANNGDASAMTEYPSLMQKATEMQNKISGLQNNFSNAQLSRMMKIQTKMTNAALNFK